jgi:sirohydrochlorin ferrochelatase
MSPIRNTQIYIIPFYIQSGNFVKDDVWHALIVVISNASELQGYSVRSLYKALQACGAQVWRHN